MAEHLLDEVERLQLDGVAAEQDRIVGEDVAEPLEMADDELELLRDALVEQVVGAAGIGRRRLEQASPARFEIGADRRLGGVDSLLVERRLAGGEEGPGYGSGERR